MARLDESEIYKWFDVFKNDNRLVEIRLIGSSKNGSGYFSDPQTLIESIRPYSDSFNIYFVINTINPACYSREREAIFSRFKTLKIEKHINIPKQK